jgi:hypothetical protein
MDAFTKSELEFKVAHVMPRTKRTEDLLAMKEAAEVEQQDKV